MISSQPASRRSAGAPHTRRERDVTLLELLDRLLAGGVAIRGDITLAVADIDLVDISLLLVVGAVDTVGRDVLGPLRRGQER